MNFTCNVTDRKELKEKIKKILSFFVIMFILLLFGGFNLKRLGIYNLGMVGQILGVLTIVMLVAYILFIIVFLISKDKMKKQGQKCDVCVTDTVILYISKGSDTTEKPVEVPISEIVQVNKLSENCIEIIVPNNEYYFASVENADEFMSAVNR